MKQLTHLFVVLVMGIFALSMVTGCSDSSSSSSSNLQQGDPNDPQFQAGRTYVESGITAAIGAFAAGSNYLGGFNPPLSAGTADTMAYGYNDQTGWWWYYAEEDYGSFYYIYADSIRYSEDGTPQQQPDDDTDKVEMKINFEMDAEEQGTYVEYEYGMDWVVTFEDGSEGEIVVFNGTGGYITYVYYEGEEAANALDYEYTDVKFSEEFLDGYWPYAGTTGMQLSWYYGQELESYDVTVTYYQDHYHIYVSDGTYYWEWDEYYEG
ncbi:MAG: hypothetical protein GF307_07620 [candidate division Zixibacteria bacterium]|nr:hypothetical protein [candidate division Zixibacteria bacterium]